MIEFFLCSLVTILPDYLYRRYKQGKRFGYEITFFTVWYELRWGITSALMLTIALITLVFFLSSNNIQYAVIVPYSVHSARNQWSG